MLTIWIILGIVTGIVSLGLIFSTVNAQSIREFVCYFLLSLLSVGLFIICIIQICKIDHYEASPNYDTQRSSIVRRVNHVTLQKGALLNANDHFDTETIILLEDGQTFKVDDRSRGEISPGRIHLIEEGDTVDYCYCNDPERKVIIGIRVKNQP